MLRRQIVSSLVTLPMAFLVSGCWVVRTTRDVMRTAEAVKSTSDLESRIGAPDVTEKMGPFEKWMYKCRDGSVYIWIFFDDIKLVTTVDVGVEEVKKAIGL